MLLLIKCAVDIHIYVVFFLVVSSPLADIPYNFIDSDVIAYMSSQNWRLFLAQNVYGTDHQLVYINLDWLALSYISSETVLYFFISFNFWLTWE